MSNISDRFRSYRPELDTGWDIYGYLSHADFLNMRNKGAKWCQIYSSFAAIKHVQLIFNIMSICQSLTRSGSTPRSQRLATAWAKRCIGLPLGNFCWDAPNEARNEKGMKRREKGKKVVEWKGAGAEQTWQGTGWCPPNLIVLQFLTMFYLSDRQIGQLNSWNHEKPLPLRDSPSPLRADPTLHAHWQGFEFRETLDVS